MKSILAIIGLIAVLGYWQHESRIGEDAAALIVLGNAAYGEFQRISDPISTEQSTHPPRPRTVYWGKEGAK